MLIFRLILPNGLRFCTDKEIRTLVPKSHSFVLTKEDGEKSLGVSLIFYEEVRNWPRKRMKQRQGSSFKISIDIEVKKY